MHPVIVTTNSGAGGWGNQEFNTGVPSYSGTDQADANGKGSFEENVLAHHDLISRSTGTAIGNMTGGGNLAASFDGSLYKAYAASSQTASNPDDGGYIGKDWGSGQSKTVTRVIVHPAIEYGFVGGTADTTFSVTLRGSDSVPSDYKADGTQLATSGSLTDSNTRVPYDTLSSGHSVTTSTAYRYHWVVIEPLTIDDDAFVSQCEFFEASDKNYLAPCTANLPEIEIGQEADDLAHDYFNTVLYTGDTNSPRTISGVGFEPGITFLKPRSSGSTGMMFDDVRGAGSNKQLSMDGTSAEGLDGSYNSATYGFLSAFNSDGFVLTDGSTNGNWVNADGTTFVSWNWKLGTAFSNDASDTSIGDIDTTGQVDEDAGISCFTYTGSGSAGDELKHGLTTVPHVIWARRRNTGNSTVIYHHANTSAPETDYLDLSNYNTTQDDSNLPWNDTAPTTSVITVSSSNFVNASSDTYVIWCWSERSSYSKFGSYIGNGNANGTFAHTGFPVAFTLIKRTDSISNWYVHDNIRDTTNQRDNNSLLDAATSEGTSNIPIDFLSNGFKQVQSDSNLNVSGGTYIYMAFSSGTGFKYANAI